MTLSDRLKEAQRQRRVEAGEVQPDPAPPIDLTTAPAGAPPLPAVEGIEYQPALRLVRDDPPPGRADIADADVCPTCRGPAKVDLVDLVGQTTHLSCDRCGTLWYTSRRARTTTQP